MSIRSFLALPVPESIQYALGELAAGFARQDKANEVRWVDESNYHVTLAFLGEQSMATLDQLADHMATSNFNDAIDLHITGLSPFPEGSPKLLAAMVAENDNLNLLHSVVQKSVRHTGIMMEKRRFKPHVTLGRLRKPKKPSRLFIPQQLQLTEKVDELILYESILTPTGARYEPIYEFSFS